MNILVIGANGFLGSVLVSKALDKGWKVDCVYNANKQNIPTQCDSYPVSALEDIDKEYEIVYLLAANIPTGKYNIPTSELLETNIELPLRVIKKFPLAHIVFSSSVSVYGVHEKTITEQSEYRNPTLYGLSKLSAETTLAFHEKTHILRFSSLYGKGMSHKTFVPLVIDKAKESKKITLLGNGERLQDYIHVHDAADLCIKAGENQNYGVYLGVCGRSYSNTEVAKIIASNIPDCTIEYVGDDKTPSSEYDNSYTKEVLSFTPTVSLEKGIKEMINE